jgi:integrase
MRGYLAKGTDWLEGVQNYSARKLGEITVYSPEEMSRLLEHADNEILPFIAIGGFAGLRSAEILRLDWRDVDLKEDFIEVSAANSKVGCRRIVPVKDNLRQWLLTIPSGQRKGPVVPVKSVPKRLARLSQKAGVEWKHNALRHSCISYRMAESGDVARVSDEAGNSPTVIRSNYLKRVRSAVAAEWFSIAPTGAGNVVALEIAS